MSRRDFLAAALRLAGAAAGAPALAALAGEAEPVAAPDRSVRPAASTQPPATSRVCQLKYRRVLNGLKVNPLRLRDLFEQTLLTVSGCSDAASAWRVYLREDWRVLLKFTRFIGAETGTEREMMLAVLDSLRRSDFDMKKICVTGCKYGEYEKDLLRPAEGWSARTVPTGQGEEQMRAYLDGIDAVVNIPSLMDHVQAGVGCALFNVSSDFIRRPGLYSGRGLHRMIAEVAGASRQGRTPPVILTIVNALQSIYNGGPKVVGSWMESTRSLWASTDMVAVDRLAADWIDKRRLQEGMKTLAQDGREALHIAMAGEMGLGNYRRERIVIERATL